MYIDHGMSAVCLAGDMGSNDQLRHLFPNGEFEVLIDTDERIPIEMRMPVNFLFVNDSVSIN